MTVLDVASRVPSHKALSLLLALVLLLGLVPVPQAAVAVSNTFYVDAVGGSDGNPGTSALPFKSITLGMSTVTTGGTVYVRPGTYSAGNTGDAFPIHLKSDVRLMSTAGRNVTTIQGDGAHNVIIADGGWTSGVGLLQGFTITGGYGFNSSYPGGGVCMKSSGVTVDNCRLTGNSAHMGGGLAVYSVLATVTNNIVDSNVATFAGGAIGRGGGGIALFQVSNGTVVSGNSVYGNVAVSNDVNAVPYQGGGILLWDARAVTVSNNTVYSNAAYNGGGISTYGTHAGLLVNANTVYSNTAVADGGGIRIGDLSIDTFTNNVVRDNTAGGTGGGIVAGWHATPLIVNHTVTANEAAVGDGLAATNDATPTVGNCILWGNGGSTGTDLSGCTASYSDVGTTTQTLGYDCISRDPVFSAPSIADYRLWHRSPCIDTGWNSITGTPASDRNGNARPQDGDNDTVATVDMGAYEMTYDGPDTLYVKTTGNDTTGRGTWTNPFRNVHPAAGFAFTGDAVEVREGTFDTQWVHIDKPGVTLRGVGANLTTLTAAVGGPVVYFGNKCSTTSGLDAVTVTGGDRGVHVGGSGPTISRCVITGCGPNDGAGVLSVGGYPTLDGCTVTGNHADGAGGAVSMNSSSLVTLRNTSLTNNTAGYDGGAVQVRGHSGVIIDRCTIADNHAGRYGGGVYLDYIGGGVTATITGTVMVGNQADVSGGAVSVQTAATATVAGCTVIDNVSPIVGGILYAGRGTVSDCILRGNGPDISGVHATYSDVESWYPDAASTPGAGCISADPLFADRTGRDFHLTGSSPCIDAGAASDVGSLDRDGCPRPQDGDGNGSALWDMGAYERPFMMLGNGSGLTGTSAVDVTSNFAGGIGWMQYSVDPGVWTNLVLYQSPFGVTLPAGDGTKTVGLRCYTTGVDYVEFSRDIVLDTAAPSGTFSVNAGASWTNTTTVSMDSSMSADTASMLFEFPGDKTPRVPYATHYLVTMTDTAEGTKNFTARYRDSAANETVLTDSIGLDRTKPLVPEASSPTHVYDTTWYSDAAPAFAFRADDALSGIAGYSFSLDTTALTVPDTVSEGTTRSASYASLADGTWYFHVRAVDAAGNWGDPAHVKINIDAHAPTGTFAVNNGAELTSSTAAFANSSVTDLTGISMIFGGDVGSSSWQSYAASCSIALTPGDGTKTVVATYKDAAVNTFVASDTIVLDQTPPSGTMVLKGGAAYTSTRTVTVDSAVSDLHGPVTMRIDAGGVYGSWTAYASAVTTSLVGAEGSRTVTAQYRDALGNVGTIADDIMLGPNRAPVAVDDTAAVAANTTLTVTGPGVLANDSDPDSDTLTATLSVQPANGALVLSANGSYTYRPASGWSGTDTFTYRASDGTTLSAPATVTITVAAPPALAINSANFSNPIAYAIKSLLTTKMSFKANTSDVSAKLVVHMPAYKGKAAYDWIIYNGKTSNAAGVNFTLPAWNGKNPANGAVAPYAANFGWTLTITKAGQTTVTKDGSILLSTVYFKMVGSSAAGAAHLHVGYLKAGSVNIYVSATTTAPSDRLAIRMTGPAGSGYTAVPTNSPWTLPGTGLPTGRLTGTTAIRTNGNYTFYVTGTTNVTYSFSVIE